MFMSHHFHNRQIVHFNVHLQRKYIYYRCQLLWFIKFIFSLRILPLRFSTNDKVNVLPFADFIVIKDAKKLNLLILRFQFLIISLQLNGMVKLIWNYIIQTSDVYVPLKNLIHLFLMEMDHSLYSKIGFFNLQTLKKIDMNQVSGNFYYRN